MKSFLIIAIFPFFLQSCQKELTTISKSPDVTIDEDTSALSCNYYPLNNWGMLAYEDKWPSLNDYDMNDLVLSYRYDIDKDKSGKVVSISCYYFINAVGANYLNGLGVQFPFSASLVKSVSGELITGSFVKLRSNGTEAGCAKAVVIPFDNTQNLIRSKNNTNFINIRIGQEKSISDTCHVVIIFKTPVDASHIGKAPFDPFLIANGKRSTEIHLPGEMPTEKEDKSLFNQHDDDSKMGTTYQSINKLPWVLDFPDGIYKYPLEGSSLASTYLHFEEWELSNHLQYQDWSTNPDATYLINKNLYY